MSSLLFEKHLVNSLGRMLDLYEMFIAYLKIKSIQNTKKFRKRERECKQLSILYV